MFLNLPKEGVFQFVFFRNLINNVNYADCLVLKQHEVGVDILPSVVGNMLKREMPIPWLR